MNETLPALVKPKIRIITMVWGESYLADLVTMSLPSILAPGNLPSLVNDFDCEVVIVTEACFFPVLEANPVYQKIFSYCPARLVMCDDLVVSRRMYGHSLTHALHRGFEDLGEEMTEYYLAFFNADFILADGSFRTMGERIKEGEELIFSPSYCVNSEQVESLIKSRVNPFTNALSIPPREMASLILACRHNTIRAKTINQQFFHMNVSDQFYWYVDQKTLLGHQLPIALVCMKPQNVYLEPISFWDYATISMTCPTTKRCVLGDSDDFLMMELRGRDTHLELMRIGKISQEDIAEVLGGYMTADQFEMGHFPLTLHADELPVGTEKARERLKEYLDRVYKLLPPYPISHFDHPYWTGLINQFKVNQQQWHLEREQSQASLFDETPGRETTASGKHSSRMNDTALVGQKIYANMFGSLPEVTMLHPRWADFHHVMKLLDREFDAITDKKPNVLLVESEDEERVVWKRVIRDDIDCETVSVYSLLNGGGPTPDEIFDLCLLDLSWADTNSLVAMYDRIAPRTKTEGKVIAFHAGDVLRTLTDNSVRELVTIVPTNCKATFHFSGSKNVASVIDKYKSGLQKISDKRRGRSLSAAALMMKLAAQSYSANSAAATKPAYDVPECCTAITIELEVI